MNILSDSQNVVDYIENNPEPDIDEINCKRRKVTTRGLSGLGNLGNTCYMNSTLQCLSNTDLLNCYIRGEKNVAGPFEDDLKQNIINRLALKKKKDGQVQDGKIIIKAKEVKNIFRESLTYKLRNLFVVMWGRNYIYKPKEFKKTLGELMPIFKGYDQNDSQECLSFIIDQLHEETKTHVVTEFKNLSYELEEFKQIYDHYTKILNNKELPKEERKKTTDDFIVLTSDNEKNHAIIKGLYHWQQYLKTNYSRMTNIFSGVTFYQTLCTNCKHTYLNFDSYTLTPLGLPDSQNCCSIYDCLDNYYNKNEMLTDKNKYYCEYCASTRDAIKKSSMWFTPDRMIIQLKRFSNVGRMVTKNKILVTFPIKNLDVSPYLSSYTNDDCVYDLYAVIYHSGGLGGGHYVAYAKNFINNLWYLYDDQHVLHIPDSDIESRLVTSGAYVLFYQKV